MGLLIKHQIETKQPFIKHEKEFSTGQYFAMTKPPFLIGKLVDFKGDQDKTLDFKSRQINYIVRQSPGYSIFFIQAGFAQPPTKIIKDHEIENCLDQMAMWYFETFIKKNKALVNRFKIKTS